MNVFLSFSSWSAEKDKWLTYGYAEPYAGWPGRKKEDLEELDSSLTKRTFRFWCVWLCNMLILHEKVPQPKQRESRQPDIMNQEEPMDKHIPFSSVQL